MDPTVAGVLVNLLSQAIWELGATSAKSAREIAETKPLAEALARAGQSFDALGDAETRETAIEVLAAPETKGIVRALYLHRLDNPGLSVAEAKGSRLCK
jgi:hypothetical protein